jgi:hypothetical protein
MWFVLQGVVHVPLDPQGRQLALLLLIRQLPKLRVTEVVLQRANNPQAKPLAKPSLMVSREPPARGVVHMD